MTAVIHTAISENAIDIAAENARLYNAGVADAGAIVCFTGMVRGGDVLSLTLEHYPNMTEKSMRQIAAAAADKWQLLSMRVIHRVGKMKPGDIIVFVGASSRHRVDAFNACAYIMDYLKTQAPFWKKEQTAAGERWVDARDTDDKLRLRWE